ncbi:MAG: 30S ribosomal protein S20 [Desulfobacteraceae bacterium]
MANHKSALKRARQNETRRMKNKSIRSAMKTDIKKAVSAKDQGAENTTELLNRAKASIARAAQKGVLHKNTAARKTSKLERFAS